MSPPKRTRGNTHPHTAHTPTHTHAPTPVHTHTHPIRAVPLASLQFHLHCRASAPFHRTDKELTGLHVGWHGRQTITLSFPPDRAHANPHQREAGVERGCRRNVLLFAPLRQDDELWHDQVYAARNPHSRRFSPFTHTPRDCIGKNFAQVWSGTPIRDTSCCSQPLISAP